MFFRKFYLLAFLRLKKLVEDLELSAYLQKIWTTFEYSILNHIHLMEDRHLDQLLMCSIYIFARSQNMSTQFRDIMTLYRSQPQAESHVYREVLGADNTRCDIIEFYNKIYVKQMQDFVLKLKRTSAEDVSLSPLPVTLRCQQSPRKVSRNHCIYVSELQTNEKILQSPESISYKFNSSPMKDTVSVIFVFFLYFTFLLYKSILVNFTIATIYIYFVCLQNLVRINKLVSDELNANGKRAFASVDHVPYTNKKLQGLMTDRQENTDK